MAFVKTHDISELSQELIGKQVVLGGWIEDLRKLGKMSFITLRDISGISQVIVKGEVNDTDKKYIEDVFFPTKILAINVVWAKGIEKTKAIVSGKWTPKFPIDTKKIIEIVKNIRNLDIEIEFEDK